MAAVGAGAVWTGSGGLSASSPPALPRSRRRRRWGPGAGRVSARWRGLEAVDWEGGEASASSELCARRVSPPWRVLLLSDGSVTRHLQAATGNAIDTDCLAMQAEEQEEEGGQQPLHASAAAAAAAAEIGPGPRIRREVVLRDAHGNALVYAASWWREEDVSRYLNADVRTPIWSSLASKRIELFRDIRSVQHGRAGQLMAQHLALAHDGDSDNSSSNTRLLWAREYLFWHGGRPLTAIFEAFSPALQMYFGPTYAPAPPHAHDRQ
eukprot:jgi/Chlat1/6941/Chrsp52S06608